MRPGMSTLSRTLLLGIMLGCATSSASATQAVHPPPPCPPDQLAGLHMSARPGYLLQVAANGTLDLPDIIASLFQPGWESLDKQQQKVLAPFAPEWDSWPAAEKRSWLAFAERMKALPEEQRLRARQRIREWANLSPEERRIARLNYQNSRRRPMPERVRAWTHYQALTDAEREQLRHSEQASRIAAAQRARALGVPPPPAQAPAMPDADVLVIVLHRDGGHPAPGLLPPPPTEGSDPSIATLAGTAGEETVPVATGNGGMFGSVDPLPLLPVALHGIFSGDQLPDDGRHPPSPSRFLSCLPPGSVPEPLDAVPVNDQPPPALSGSDLTPTMAIPEVDPDHQPSMPR